MPASQRDREARIAIIVVLATAIGLIVIALSGRGSETDAASSDEMQSLAAADATESTESTATPSDAAATDPAGSTPTSARIPCPISTSSTTRRLPNCRVMRSRAAKGAP